MTEERHEPTPGMPRLVLAAGSAVAAYLATAAAEWLAGCGTPPAQDADPRWRAGIAVGHQLDHDTRREW